MHLERLSLPLVLVALSLNAPASSLNQDRGGESKDKPRLVEPEAAGGDAARDEMVELFHKVERRLGEIDKLLYQASAGERALTPVGESGIAELLKSSKTKSVEVQRDIDRILEIAQQNGGT